MSIVVQCDCGKTYKVADKNAGKKMRCKACNGVVAIPKPEAGPADEWDDFGGDDFGGFGDGGDDFGGDDFGDEAYSEAAPRPKSKSGAKSRGKGGGKSKGKGTKSAKSGKEMAPALKYSLAGGIVVVTAGIVLGILYSRGVIGSGGKKDGGNDVAQKDDGTPPGGAGMAAGTAGEGNPNVGNPGGDPGGPDSGGGNPGGLDPGGLDPVGGNLDGQSPSGKPVWRKYVSKDRRFEAEFPARVRTATLKKAATSYVFEARTRNGRFTIIYSANPAYTNIPGEEQLKMLEKVAVEKKAESKKRITILGKPGLQVEKSISSRDKLVMRQCFIGDRMYNILAVGPKQNWDEQSAKRFFDSFKAHAGGGGTTTPPAAGDVVVLSGSLLKAYKPGNNSLAKRRIRVIGKVAKPLSRDGWIVFEGDGTRAVGCHFATPPASPPGVGQAVTIEGEFTRNNAQFITLIKSRIVTGNAKPGGNGGGKTPAATQEQAIAAIKKLGGKVTIDEKSPGKPVVEVVMRATSVTDADLMQLRILTGLKKLDLSRTKVSDAGLVHLKGLTKLQTLTLFRTQISDAGLAHLKGLTELRELILNRSTKVTNAGLVHLKALTELQTLLLGYSQVTDAGLVHLKGLTNLKSLNLAGTKVTDTGLVHLKGLTKLETLFFIETKVTAAGVKKLQAALPNCIIFR